MKRYKCVCNAFDFPMDAGRNSVESGNVDSPAWDSLVWSGLVCYRLRWLAVWPCLAPKRKERLFLKVASRGGGDVDGRGRSE